MDDRPKHLPPTLRGRKRYMAFQVISENDVLIDDLTNSIWHSLLNFLGEYGVARAGVWISKNNYDANKKMGLISCNHTSVEHVRTALALIQRIGDSRAIIKVLGVSGTIRAAKAKFFGEVDLQSFG